MIQPLHETHDRQSSSQDVRPETGQGPVLGLARIRATPCRGQGARRQAGEQGRGRLHRARHRGARRARAGAPASRHVYRGNRREGAASPVRRSDRQRHGRGARGACHLHRGRAGGGRLRDRDRQRPRHSGRSASQVQEQVRARSDHVHVARGRKVRVEGVWDFGRPARRRHLGRQRAVGSHGGRGRARADALPHGVRAREAEGQAGEGRPRAQPARHQGALPAGSRHFRSEGAFQAGTRIQDGALQGLFVRRGRNPLGVCKGAPARRRGRAGEGHLPLRRRAQGISVGGDQRRHPGPSRYLHRQCRQDRRSRRGAMGGGVDRRQRRLPVLLLQHHPDAGRRHARVRACAPRC